MPKNIKYKRTLPIKPTNKPSGSDVAAVAMAALDISQHSLLSPSAVLTALSCAFQVYAKNLELNGGFDEKTIGTAKDLGVKMADALMAPKDAAALVTPTQGLVSAGTGLVGLDGKPLEIDESAQQQAPEGEAPSQAASSDVAQETVEP